MPSSLKSQSLKSRTSDCLVVGGGVVGLSIAYQLACDGLSVTLLERAELGREASWAGAGILPPGSWYSDHPVLDVMAEASREAYAVWSERLREETGIDNEYWQCGSRYIQTPQNADFLAAAFARWQSLGITVTPTESSANGETAFDVPQEAQVRNPRQLKAVTAACRKRGVQIITGSPVEAISTESDRVLKVTTPQGDFSAENYCLAAGCWTPGLVERAGASLGGKPMRGQMLLLKPHQPRLESIVHVYPYYVVPRRDGRILVGATVEDVGFDKQTTEEAKQSLLAVAEQVLLGGLEGVEVEQFWSGLRPNSGEELPQIGRLSQFQNLWVATGHFRSGLQLAPSTAELISQLLRGEPPALPAEVFAPR